VKRILVVGDLMIDNYLWGSCSRISPEAPVQIVDIENETKVLGGAGNVVRNLKSFQVEVSVLSVIGKDETANELKNMFSELKISADLIVQEDRKTSKKTRIIASHSQVVRFDKETKEEISSESEKRLLEIFHKKYSDYDLILLSDYGKGVLTENICRVIIDNSKKVLVDPKGTNYQKYSGAFLLTPNKKESEIATGIKISDEVSLKNALHKLKEISNLRVPLITLSEEGIAFLDGDKVVKKPTVAREVYDVTGAGDTVLASLGFSILNGNSVEEAVEFANLSAGVVVGKIGNAIATLQEIESYKNSLHQNSIESKIKSWVEVSKIVEESRDQKIVFTNGVFDILHRGHVSYLHTAKSFGDILILGLNSDKSVKRLKGEERPINSEYDRAFLLSALESVDFVTIFEEDTPLELIKIVKPNVLVKGGDYEGQIVVGSEIADEVKIVSFVDGKSTTKTIEKIRSKI
jgi:D-beta-D-heptose 7-phosphate kinase/D-beta-D-heptose 1-phosphate adenosyltransferase